MHGKHMLPNKEREESNIGYCIGGSKTDTNLVLKDKRKLLRDVTTTFWKLKHRLVMACIKKAIKENGEKGENC